MAHTFPLIHTSFWVFNIGPLALHNLALTKLFTLNHQLTNYNKAIPAGWTYCVQNKWRMRGRSYKHLTQWYSHGSSVIARSTCDRRKMQYFIYILFSADKNRFVLKSKSQVVNIMLSQDFRCKQFPPEHKCSLYQCDAIKHSYACNLFWWIIFHVTY